MNPPNLMSYSIFRVFATTAVLISATSTTLWSVHANAQVSAPAAPAQPVAQLPTASPAAPLAGDEISVATREYLKVSGAENQHQLILNFMTDAAVNAARNLLGESLKSQPIDAKNPLNAQPIVNKRLAEFSQTARKQLASKFTWAKIVEEVYQPVFRRNFTLVELKTAIEFYKSPVGKKFTEKSPQVYSEALKSMGEVYKQAMTDEVQPLAVDFVQKTRGELKGI
jgi:hypothetical protein